MSFSTSTCYINKEETQSYHAEVNDSFVFVRSSVSLLCLPPEWQGLVQLESNLNGPCYVLCSWYLPGGWRGESMVVSVVSVVECLCLPQVQFDWEKFIIFNYYLTLNALVV